MQASSLLTVLFLLGWSSAAWAQDREPPPQDGGAPTVAADASPPTGTAQPPATPPADDAGAPPEISAEPEPATSSNQEMVVTGSRIKQASSFSPAASVQVMDRKELEQTGATNENKKK